MEGFTIAAENNRVPILHELERLLVSPGDLLEVGSGSGQHAAAFSEALGHVNWHPSEVAHRVPALTRNLARFERDNLRAPIVLEVGRDDFPPRSFHYVLAINVLHIAPADCIASLMAGAARTLHAGGLLLLYGPFRYAGEFTTVSNARFDAWLKSENPASGIRDIETLDREGAANGLSRVEDIAMPANNQLLVYVRNERS